MMPRRAAAEMAPMIATGIAMSSGHGVAMTTTLRNRTGFPDHHHAAVRERERQRRIPGAELIADAPERSDAAARPPASRA